MCKCARASTACEKVHTTFVAFLLLFCQFCLSVFFILKPFLTKNKKKTVVTLKKGIDNMQLFGSFIFFLHFSQFSKMSEICPKMEKLGKLRNKSKEIKKFPHILEDNMKLFVRLIIFLFSQEVL